MSRTRDGGAPNDQTTTQVTDGHDSEPADPDNPNHEARCGLPLVPESVKTDCLPKPFRADNGGAVTVAEAGKTYLRIQLSNLDDESLTSKHERHNYELYPRILSADRHFSENCDGLTTAMLTRRLSPTDDSGSWLTPWECNDMLHGGSVHRSVRNALDYNAGEFEFEWIAVTAPTESAGTPHEHIYLWIEDPEDAVTVEHLAPALEKHLKRCPNAYEKNHRYRPDGSDGAITVQHDPDLRKNAHPKVAKQILRGNTAPRANTRGAHYLASQLVHMHLGDYLNDEKADPPDVLFEGAALAWASPYNWFRSSGGVPSLGVR